MLQAAEWLAERGFGKVPGDATLQNLDGTPLPGMVVQVIGATAAGREGGNGGVTVGKKCGCQKA